MIVPPQIAAMSESLAAAVAENAVVTPLDEIPYLSTGSKRVFGKREDQQTTGSFKIRGASAKLATLAKHQLAAGVVAASTGNHGLAVAHAAARRGAPATVYVPDSAHQAKTERIEAAGAQLVVIPGNAIAAETTARRRAEEQGQVYISPYNDAAVVAGQGTIGLELANQLSGPFTLVVAVGGGGLIAGTAASLAGRDVHVVGTSPSVDAAMAVSVAEGRVVAVEAQPTLSDGTAGNLEPDTITFDLCRQLVDEWLLEPEAAIEVAHERHRRETGELIEGSASLALAAAADLDVSGDVVVIICGGNV